MTQPHQSEENPNIKLGDLLRGMLSSCMVRTENTSVFVDHHGLKADVLITAQGRAPVVMESEYEPGQKVEEEAIGRLGLVEVGSRREIEAAIAVKYPEEVAEVGDVAKALAVARLRYCVFTGDADEHERFPEEGWLEGGVSDLADMAQLVSVPQKAVEEAADILEKGIENAVAVLDGMSAVKPGITESIAALLGLSDVPETRRMACAIMANALVFHEQLAGMYHGRVKPIRLVCGAGVLNPQEETLSAWTEILKINYWPIFAIARDILGQMPALEATNLLHTLRGTAQAVVSTGVTNAHDLTGLIFQELIADRKYLATFYTLPSSAALLARLAVAKLKGVDWSDAEAISNLRVGDFACGTGALLSAVYSRIANLHERAGGDPAQLHTSMMEEVLYGCDVMPSAVHITAATLSGAYPQVPFNLSRIYPMHYGRQEDGKVRIGSLELLGSSQLPMPFNTSDPTRRIGSAGEATSAPVQMDIPDASFDIVIMNPPFTRNVTREGAYADAGHAAFAAFGATEEDQRQMAKQMRVLAKDSCYHGNAGIASAFAELGHRKLRPGGVLALVLPLSATGGLAWEKCREMLGEHYTDLTVMSIAANGRDMSFSSDTGMAECLVIARKLDKAEESESRGHFISLRERPHRLAHASSIVQRILACARERLIEDGPYGGDILSVGDDLAGEMLSMPVSQDGESWSAVRVADYTLAQTAYALSGSRLWLPGVASAHDLKTASLGTVGELGTYHLDIIGRPPRGPFDKVAPSPTSTYPALWNHNARNETRLVVEPDAQLIVRKGLEEKVDKVWATAGRSHLNLDYTFSSQPLAAAYTERRSIGGRVWPNVNFPDDRFDYAFSVWSNSTLGLISFWWHSSRQQSSKAGITIRLAETLPVLDFGALTDEQLATAEAIFEEFRDKEFKPAFLADADPNRALLDRRVVCDLLGFDEDTYEAVRLLSAKWCAEPSVHGGKKRPKNAKFERGSVSDQRKSRRIRGYFKWLSKQEMGPAEKSRRVREFFGMLDEEHGS